MFLKEFLNKLEKSKMTDYLLKSTSHYSTIMSAMNSFFQRGKLVDVTLTAEGRKIAMHRLILCSFSPYFEVLHIVP